MNTYTYYVYYCGRGQAKRTGTTEYARHHAEPGLQSFLLPLSRPSLALCNFSAHPEQWP